MGAHFNEEVNSAGMGIYPAVGGYGYGGGYGGGGAIGGVFAMIILIVVVLWLLFKDGHRGHGDFAEFGGRRGHGCGVCVEDESNWEENLKINEKLDCMKEKIISSETAHYETLQAEKISALQAKVVQLETEKDFDNRFGMLSAQIAGQFNKVDQKLLFGFDRLPHTPKFVPTGRFEQPCFPRREDDCCDC